MRRDRKVAVLVGARRRRLLVGLFALLGILCPLPLLAEELRGVVVESVGGWALEKAGVKPGDVLLSWKRLANPPANPEPAEGEFLSYFDWEELLVEQVPRGPVVLWGKRESVMVEFSVEPGLWEAYVRPVLPVHMESMYSLCREAEENDDIEKIIAAWKVLEDKTKEEGLRTWIAIRKGQVLAKRDRVEETIHACQTNQWLKKDFNSRIRLMRFCAEINENINALAEAEKILVAALELKQASEAMSVGAAEIMSNLGELAKKRNEIDRAQELYLHALTIIERLAPRSLQEAGVLNDLAVLARDRGDAKTAVENSLSALAIIDRLAPGSVIHAVSLGNLGVWYAEQGNLDQSELVLSRSLDILSKLAKNSQSLATCLNNVGVIARFRGNFEAAQNYFLRSLQMRKIVAENSTDVANSLNNLGSLARDRGELSSAERYHLRAKEIYSTLEPASLSSAAVLNNLGLVAFDREDYKTAVQYYHEVLQIKQKFDHAKCSAAGTMNNLGHALQKLKNFETAETYYLDSLKILEECSPGGLSLATTLNNFGTLESDRKALNRALEYHSKALAIREKIAPKSLEYAISLGNIAKISKELGEVARACEFYERAVNVLEFQARNLGGAYESQAAFRGQRSEYFRVLINLLIRRDRSEAAFQFSERYRANTFLTMLAERDIIFGLDIPEDLDRQRRRLGVLYNRALARLVSSGFRGHAKKVDDMHQDLEALQDQIRDVEARIRSTAPRLANLQYPESLDMERVRHVLDRGTLLLSFSVGSEETALFALSARDELAVKILPFGKSALEMQVNQMMALIPLGQASTKVETWRLQYLHVSSHKFYKLLFESVAEKIAACDRLLILPDGPLHALPFGALVSRGADEEGGLQYLIEWKPLHTALSATVYAELKQRRPAAAEAAAPDGRIQLAAFGDPRYPQNLASTTADLEGIPQGDAVVRSVADRGIFDWEPLPNTRHEVESIASLFPEGATHTFLGSEALEERVKTLDPKPRILHLAAHAHTDEHLPMSSFIALTIPDEVLREDVETERDNGLLQVWEIFERVRLDADLVVLSACETGLGKELGGEGLIGLTRAFQYAGARSVMASLWKVADRSTAELMIRFYRHLLAGLPKDEALRAAQMELIRGPITIKDADGEEVQVDYSAPYHWAAFQIYGDWQ